MNKGNVVCLCSGVLFVFKQENAGIQMLLEDITVNEISWFQRDRYWLLLLMYGFWNSEAQKLRAASWRPVSVGRERGPPVLESIHSCCARRWGSGDLLYVAQPVVNNSVLHTCLCEDGRSVSWLVTKKQSKQKRQRETQQFVEVMSIFIILIVVTVPGVCANVQSHHIVYFKYVECFVCLLDLN